MSREVITPTQPQDALESCAKPRGVSTLCLGKLGLPSVSRANGIREEGQKAQLG